MYSLYHNIDLSYFFNINNIINIKLSNYVIMYIQLVIGDHIVMKVKFIIYRYAYIHIILYKVIYNIRLEIN